MSIAKSRLPASRPRWPLAIRQRISQMRPTQPLLAKVAVLESGHMIEERLWLARAERRRSSVKYVAIKHRLGASLLTKYDATRRTAGALCLAMNQSPLDDPSVARSDGRIDQIAPVRAPGPILRTSSAPARRR